jgi:hypothetical protein
MPNFYNRLRARKFSTVSDTAVEISAYNSATPNFTIDAGGKLNWSSGSAVADTNLYRSAANVLKTDDSFNVASGHTYKIDGADVLSATSLGSSVVDSYLTSLGTVNSLTATTGTISNLTSSTPNFYGPLTNTGTSTFNGRVDVSEIREKVSSVSVSMRKINMQLCRWLRILYCKHGWNNFKLHCKCNKYSYR